MIEAEVIYEEPCTYCDPVDSTDLIWASEIETSVYIDENGNLGVYKSDGTEEYKMKTPIKFCPMCGRSLSHH